jgi:maleate isomerase
MQLLPSNTLIGIGTPQANPTVEAEFRQLLPDSVNMQVSRLTSASDDSATRLCEYLQQLGETIKQYGGMPLSAYGFACTCSTYLLGDQREAEIIAALNLPYPVITAAAAIEQHLQQLNAKTIALAMPYPPALAEKAVAYWSEKGYRIQQLVRVDIQSTDTRNIYKLSNSDAMQALSDINCVGLDAIVVTGTGMPSLAALSIFNERSSVPAFSSNIALANALLKTL